MESMLPSSQRHSFSIIKFPSRAPIPVPSSFLFLKNRSILYSQVSLSSTLTGRRHTVVVASTTTEKQAMEGFVDEMREVAMKLHTRDQAREGQKEPKGPPVSEWEPSINGYLRFLMDSKIVYDTLEMIVQKAPHPSCMFVDFIVLVSSISVDFSDFIVMVFEDRTALFYGCIRVYVWREGQFLSLYRDSDWVPTKRECIDLKSVMGRQGFGHRRENRPFQIGLD